MDLRCHLPPRRRKLHHLLLALGRLLQQPTARPPPPLSFCMRYCTSSLQPSCTTDLRPRCTTEKRAFGGVICGQTAPGYGKTPVGYVCSQLLCNKQAGRERCQAGEKGTWTYAPYCTISNKAPATGGQPRNWASTGGRCNNIGSGRRSRVCWVDHCHHRMSCKRC